MALALPAQYIVSNSTSLSRRSNVLGVTSDAGYVRYLDLGAVTYWEGTVSINNIGETDKTALLDWLETNETTEISVTIGTEIYNGYLDTNGSIQQSLASGTSHLWEVSFDFIGSRT